MNWTSVVRMNTLDRATGKWSRGYVVSRGVTK